MRTYRKLGATIAFSLVVVLALAGLNTAALMLVRSQHAVDDMFRFMSMTPYSPGGAIGGGARDPQMRFAAGTMTDRRDPNSAVPIVVD